MKMSNMQKTQPESDSEDSDDEETTLKPDLECAIIHHQGSVNRVRVLENYLSFIIHFLLSIILDVCCWGKSYCSIMVRSRQSLSLGSYTSLKSS